MPDMSDFSSDPGKSPGFALLGILTVLAHGKRLISRVTGIAMLAGLVTGFSISPRYTATTKIMPPRQTQSEATLLLSQLGSPGVSSLMAAGGGLGLRNPNDIYVGLLQSQPIADAIIARFDLEKAYQSKDRTAARLELAAATQITSERSGFIAIAVTDKDKNRAAAIANAYTDQLRTLTKTLAVTEASERRLFYEEQLKQVKDALVQAESFFQQVQQKNGLIQLDAQARTMISSLAVLRAQIDNKEVELKALRSFSTERNPEVELVQNQLSSLKDQLARLQQRTHSSAARDLGLEDVPGAGLDYLRAEHEVKYQQALFDLLLKQYDAARLDEAKTAAVIQVVEGALAPERKSSPHRSQILLLFMLAGFSGACVLVYLRSRLDLNPDARRSLGELRGALLGSRRAKALSDRALESRSH